MADASTRVDATATVRMSTVPARPGRPRQDQPAAPAAGTQADAHTAGSDAAPQEAAVPAIVSPARLPERARERPAPDAVAAPAGAPEARDLHADAAPSLPDHSFAASTRAEAALPAARPSPFDESSRGPGEPAAEAGQPPAQAARAARSAAAAAKARMAPEAIAPAPLPVLVLPLAGPAARRTSPAGKAPPDVHVRIGRIDVRPAPAQESTPPAAPTPARARGFDEYHSLRTYTRYDY